MSIESADEVKARYIRLMGPAGEVFAELRQDAARLHQKWNEFVRLFGVSEAQIEVLNRAAPGLFYLVQDAWWDNIILHIFRVTDGNKKALSLPNLKNVLNVGIRDAFDRKLQIALAASRFARDLRNADIGHRNRDVALRVQAFPPSSRAQVVEAIAASTTRFISSTTTTRAAGPRFTTTSTSSAAQRRFCGS